jgi:shikimate kinase/3-dehydroquinate synthase
MPATIVLSGFMATGKSTIGPALAKAMGVPFVDTDAEIEREAGGPIAKIWAEKGEPAFREMEAAVAERLLRDATPRVIAFGGGTVTNRTIRHLALDRAIVVTLTARPETIVDRVDNLAARPNLAGGDPVRRAEELLAARADAYAECHTTIDTDAGDPQAIVADVLRLAQRNPLVVPLGQRSYCIDVGFEAPRLSTEAIARLHASSLVVVTDETVLAARGTDLDEALGSLNMPTTKVVLSPGEANKTQASVQKIWDAALGAGIDRDALIVAFGGGVVGDLAGFAAATLLRGVRVVQIPTTLLAMVDASVGGKTGFDHATGKNLIGAFHQPSAVVVDLDHLATLSARHRASGLAEVVKVALTSDAELFARLEGDFARVAVGDPDALRPVVRAAIRAKIAVVRDDERESGLRALLNLGHTVGHALEAYGRYSKYTHGEAVAVGTVAELQVGASLGRTPPEVVARARNLFSHLGLGTSVSRTKLEGAWPFVSTDKKRQRSFLKLPVVTAVGQAHVEAFSLGQVRDALLPEG